MTPKQKLLIKEANRIITKNLYDRYDDLTEEDIEELSSIASMRYFEVCGNLDRFSNQLVMRSNYESTI